ncbi:MAG: hypothetical protein Q8P50_08360 [Bacillota bacterium]|nr:hypothetical protein [Bacillota bacterium]
MTETLGIWLAAAATLSVYSYLYKENPFFRAMEHVMVGLTTAHLTIMGIQNIRDMAVRPLTSGQKWYAIIPLIAGVMLLARWFKGVMWLSRIPVGFMVGVAGAVTITGQLDAAFLRQIRATMMPIKGPNDLVFVVGVVSTLMYFFFTTAVSTGGAGQAGKMWGPIVGAASRFGRLVMMLAFGMGFGLTVMSRISLLIGRFQFLFGDWIPILK